MARRSRTRSATKLPLGAVGALTAAGVAAYTRHTGRRRREERRRFRLGPGEPAAAGLHRVLDGRFDVASDEFERRQHDRTRAVHEMRKSIKRLRTVLRVARGALDNDVRRHANANLRGAGRQLAAVRDAAAVADVIQAVAARHAEEIHADELARLRQRVGLQRASVRTALEDGERGPLVDSATLLRATQERLHEHPMAPGLDTTPLLAGLRRIYRQGRSGYRRVLEAPTTENLHAWRKRVKDLRYGAELLGDAAPKRLRQVRRRARTLSEVLGDDHDLAVLGEMAGDCPSLLAAIQKDRARLQSKAHKLGKKLYARPPRRFVRRAQRRARRASA